MHERQRGFTFIEVLVVMGIIAVLVGLSVAGITYFLHTRMPAMETSNRLNKISGYINGWKLRFERYPPSDPKKIHKAAGGKPLPPMPDGFNVPIESLYQALTWPGAVEVSFAEDEKGNTDEDEFSKPTHAGEIPYELIDKWGNPFIYIEYTQYALAAESPLIFFNGEGEEVEAVPWRESENSENFAEPRGFQLFSMGEDGQPNTEDDVKAWE